MRVRMLTEQVGPRLHRRPGDVVEVSGDEGARLCAAGQAEPVRGRRVERAVARDDQERGAVS